MPKKRFYDYESEAIRVRFEPRRCIHAAECIKGAPDVFDRYRRPWIEAGASAAVTVANVVMQYPTGALHYEPLDGSPSEPNLGSAKASVAPNGPIYIQGRLVLNRPDGNHLRLGN